jgi:hypothetical protein
VTTRTALIALVCAAGIAGATTTLGSPAAGAQSACAGLGGTVDADQSCHVHTESPSYTVDIGFPVDYPDLGPVTDVLSQQRDEFVDYARQYPPRGRPIGYSLDITGTAYRSGTPDTGTRSLVLDIADDTGLANEGRPVTSHEAFNYDVGKGAPITFATLFRPGTTAQDVQQVLAKNGHPAPEPFGHSYLNFVIADDALIFFLDHDFLHEDGPAKVSVPRAELASLLA